MHLANTTFASLVLRIVPMVLNKQEYRQKKLCVWRSKSQNKRKEEREKEKVEKNDDLWIFLFARRTKNNCFSTFWDLKK